MRRTIFALGLCAILLVFFLSACSYSDFQEASALRQAAVMKAPVPVIDIEINGGRQLPSITNSIHSKYIEGNTLEQVLETSGVIELTKDKKGIASINDVALDPTHMEWGIVLNGQVLSDVRRMKTVIQENDRLMIEIVDTDVEQKHSSKSEK